MRFLGPSKHMRFLEGRNTSGSIKTHEVFGSIKTHEVSRAEGLKAFLSLSLSFPRVILGNFGKKPFPEFLKAFPDLERD